MANSFTDWEGTCLVHHGIKGQKWGVRNGPPYPLDEFTSAKVRMKSVHGSFSGNSKIDYKERFIHDKETFSSLKKRSKNSDVAKIRSDINHADDEGAYSDVGRDYNCPFCAAAFDMVERGYDVRARTAPDGSNVGDIESFYKNGKLSKTESSSEIGSMVYPKMNKSAFEKARFSFQRKIMLDKLDAARNKYEQKVQVFQTQAINNLMSNIRSENDGARGIIVVGWRLDHDLSNRTRAYHALNYKVESGKVVFYDAQSSRSWKQNGYTDTNWLYGCDPRELYHMRTDTLEPSSDVLNAVYSYRGAK